MTGNIWSTFDLEPGNPMDINILGVDAGDGEFCISWASMIALAGRPPKIRTTEHPSLDPSHDKDKQITAYGLIRDTSQPLVGEEVLEHTDSKIYVNFKKPLMGDDANQKYERLFDDGVLTYREVMRENFHTVIQRIFDTRPGLRDQPRTVLFVGRPASEIWEKSEKEYQLLLKEGLTVPNYNGTIDVVIYSEAQAALAYEYKEGHIKPDKTVVIIDGGSSTFDAVIVRNGQIIGEYSRQMGAGMIEDIMLDLFLAWKDGDSQLLQAVDTRRKMREQNILDLYDEELSLAKLKLQLRKRKEEYFGSKGINGTEDNAYAIFINGKKQRKFIDDSFMNQAIHKIPVLVRESYLQENQTDYHEQEYPSFSLAVRSFFEGVYSVCKKAGGTPDKVILSGGATVMPFVRDLAEAAFSVPVTRTDFPSFSVAEGLAFMGYVEFLKKQVLDEMKVQVHSLIYSAASGFSAEIKNAYVDSAWNSIFQQYLQAWAITDIFGDTLREWYHKSHWQIPSEVVKCGVQKQLDQSRLYAKIKEYLDTKFFNLFPNIQSNYRYTVPSDIIANSLWQVSNLNRFKLSLPKILGPFKFLFGGSWDKHYTKEERLAKYYTIQARKVKIQDDLKNQFGAYSDAAAKNVVALLQEQIDLTLVDYVEGMTPYFVQYR